jgi:D-alanyl-D-alanine carboxypeptidase-like protein
MRRLLVPLCVVLLLIPGTASGRGAPSPLAVGFRASVQEIPRHVRERMIGSSWHRGCPVGLDDLRLLRLSYWGFDREPHTGRLVVHRAYAWRVVGVFRTLYEERFPIRRMRLVDAYGADDTRSMNADNTSAFNCRYRDGVCCTWSQHAYGKAIDVDPVENPYVGSWGVSPDAGAPFVDRSPLRRGMVAHGDAVWDAFDAIGWQWGGDWKWPIDYQHFSANGR